MSPWSLRPWAATGLVLAAAGGVRAQEPGRPPVVVLERSAGVVKPASGQLTPDAPSKLPDINSPPPAAPPAPVAAGTPAAPGAPAKPATWHGHKYPVQPFPPPGAAPVLPAGPGYYTLLQLVQQQPGETPPRWPYQRLGPIMMPFPENNFSYLDSIPPAQRDWAEKLKRIPLCDHWLFSTGGEIRYRYNHEVNSQLTGRTNNYDLIRTRIYGDVWFEDIYRLYGEFLYGEILNNELPPLPRDVNRGDILNLFFDLKLCECAGNPVYFRFGQQELFYGSQRLLSPNDWGNNRNRFQAAKLFYRSEKWDADLFGGRPVRVEYNNLDPGDANRWFTGAWLTHKPKKGTFLDFYYLNLDDETPGVAAGRFKTGGFNLNTVGSRYTGRGDRGFVWDVEGMVQFGSWADQSILAQAFTAYFGWNFKDCKLNPTFWLGYDYASGDGNPNQTGTRRTFNQLFAFGHYYFGFADYVGRQNIHDFSAQAYCYPMKWLTTGVQYHVFRLDEPKDALYNAFGRPIQRDPTGAAGNDVGQEIDVVFNAHITDRQDLFVSYSHFFAGPFVKATGPGGDGDALYVQYSWRW